MKIGRVLVPYGAGGTTGAGRGRSRSRVGARERGRRNDVFQYFFEFLEHRDESSGRVSAMGEVS